MFLSEKIIHLRKKMGWSQKEFAKRLDVSSEFVSQWEKGISTPDSIMTSKMSILFNVEPAYLSKNVISMELAQEYLKLCKEASNKMALSCSACILSPVILIFMGTLSVLFDSSISTNMAAAIGVGILFILLAGAIFTFINEDYKLSKYAWIGKEVFTLEKDIETAIKKQKDALKPIYKKNLYIGIPLCILSVLPLTITSCLKASEVMIALCLCFLLICVGIGIYLIVSKGFLYQSYEKLLQLNDYSIEKKINNKRFKIIWIVYWGILLILYLIWSFKTMAWRHSWMLWPAAGLLFVPFKKLVEKIKK